ncbi:MAG: hypothetical protein HWN67_22060 [Candidatus Helarchaeota archaeon]|nr:hypothetical protein [Candidatus Helarchaeota archaeon]
MEEIQKGEFVSWESENIISILLKLNENITKYTIIPKDINYLIVWARTKEKWSTFEYYKEKKDLDTSKKGNYSLFKDAKKYLLKLDNEEFVLPHGLPKENPLVAIKSKKPSKFKKFKQKKLGDVW